jgi:hypothetical protein
VVFLIVLFRSFTSGSGEGGISGTSEYANQPAFLLTSGDTTYHGAISSNVGVAILRINSGQLFMSFGEPVRADGKFVLVTVAIENQQNTEITMNPSLFEIVDSNGRVYSSSAKSLEVGENNDLFLAGINPGITKVGQIAFDVPADLDMDNLLLRFHGGMTGDAATLPLRVNSIVTPAPTSPETTVPQVEDTGSTDNQPPVNPNAGAQSSEGVGSNQPSAAVSPDSSHPASTPSEPGSPTTGIAVGQTSAQVLAILGPPTSVTMGVKNVYVYQHLQIVFVSGKVSEIHQF